MRQAARRGAWHFGSWVGCADEAVIRQYDDGKTVATFVADTQTSRMKPANREIAIDYLDLEIQGLGVSSFLESIKKALKQDAATNLEFNVVALEIDPAKQAVTLSQDWGACQPETFSASEFVDLVETSQRRERAKYG